MNVARLGACHTWFFGHVFRDAFQRDLGFAVAEATYRNLLPTQDNLRVGFDLACEHYAATKFSFADLWCLVYDKTH